MSLKSRVREWGIALATKWLGREIEVEGRPGKARVLPFIWDGKFYIFGLNGFVDLTSIEFVKVHQARFVNCPRVAPEPLPAPPAITKRPRVVHSILCHLPKAKTEGLMNYFRQMSDDYELILAYGGKREEFDKIDFEPKYFLDDPRLRGEVFQHSYAQYLETLVRHFSKGTPPDWIFLGDYDAIPLKRNFLDPVIAEANRHGCGFLAKLITDVTYSNSHAVTTAAADGLLGWSAGKNYDVRAYHTLGPALLFSWDCLVRTSQQIDRFDGVYFEVNVPTAAALSGHKLMSVDACGTEWKDVRFRPFYEPSELPALQAAGASLVHPIKDVDGFLALAPTLAERASFTTPK